MMDIKIQGHDDAMAGENILINISLANPNIREFTLFLSESLYIDRALNYDLEKKDISQKEIIFKVDNFQFKNNLALILKSRLPKKLRRAHLNLKYNLNNKLYELRHYIRILKPHIKVIIRQQKKTQMSLRIIKKEPYLPTVIDKINLKAFDRNTGKPVDIKIERYSFDEFYENIEHLPIILDHKSAIKKITIETESPIKLQVWINYSDRQDNKYTSNVASLIITPKKTSEGAKSVVQTTPFYITEGFDFLLEPMAIA